MTSQLYAAIGIGSNAVRLLAADVREGKVGVVTRTAVVTKLAAYRVSASGTVSLDPQRVEATIEAVRQLAGEARELGADLAGTVATEAVRVSANSADLVERVSSEIGAPVTILTGEEEAALGWRGVMLDYAQGDGEWGVIDVGGGSTDLSTGTPGAQLPEAILSLPLGARQLTMRYSFNKPVEYTKSLGNLAALSIEAQGYMERFERRPQNCVVIGGTAGILMSVFRHLEGREFPEGTLLNRDWLASLFMRAAAQSQEGRGEFGIPDDVADIAPVGAAIVLVLLDLWGLRQFAVSERNILDGFLARG